VQPAIPQNPTTAEARAQELVPKGPNASQSLAALAGNDNVAFKPQVKHVISKELMLYFDKIRSALLDEDPDEEVVRLREAAFASVRDEPGLHQLVPYFVQFVAEKVTHNFKNTFVLRQMMELTAAMIANPSLYIDPYATALCAPVLTCLLGRRLGSEGSSEDLKSQYQLRELAASLIGLIAKKYEKSSHQLKQRLVRTFLKFFLDPTKPLAVHYGAISGLSTVGGPEAVHALIVPNLKPYESLIVRAQTEGGDSENSTADVEMVIASIMKALSSLKDDTPLLTDGAASMNGDHTAALEEAVGSIIGARIAAAGDHGLERAVLDAKRG
jgi:transcription initiation factor TFIID subunit 6